MDEAGNLADLVATIRAVYGLPVTRATPGPHGEVAACTILDDASGPRYFCKRWGATRQGRWAVSRLPHYLPLTRRLYDTGLFRDLPYPIPTRAGALWTQTGGATLVLFPYLPGVPLPYDAPWPDAVYDALGHALAAIHGATPALADVLPPREPLDIPFEGELRGALAALDQIGPDDRPGRQALRDLLRAQRATIDDQLARLHALQPVVRALPGAWVLCHTDIHGGNLLVNGAQIAILDWETALVAPPEHDLQAVIGPALARALCAYRESGGAGLLHVEHFTFYLIRRYLADLTDWVLRILYQNITPAQDAHDLAGIASECIAKWAALDATLAEIRAVLDAA